MKLLNKHFLKWLGQFWFLFFKEVHGAGGMGRCWWAALRVWGFHHRPLTEMGTEVSEMGTEMSEMALVELIHLWAGGWSRRTSRDPFGVSGTASTLCCHLSEGKQAALVLPGGSDTEPDLLESCAVHNIFIMTNACVVLGAFSSPKRSVILVLQDLSPYDFNTSSSVSSVLSMNMRWAKEN